MKDIELIPKSPMLEREIEAKQPTARERLAEIPALAWTAAGVVMLAIVGTVLGLRYARD